MKFVTVNQALVTNIVQLVTKNRGNFRTDLSESGDADPRMSVFWRTISLIFLDLS